MNAVVQGPAFCTAPAASFSKSSQKRRPVALQPAPCVPPVPAVPAAAVVPLVPAVAVPPAELVLPPLAFVPAVLVEVVPAVELGAPPAPPLVLVGVLPPCALLAPPWLVLFVTVPPLLALQAAMRSQETAATELAERECARGEFGKATDY
jgi:hypothetical protein